jgi:heme exporter protein A
VSVPIDTVTISQLTKRYGHQRALGGVDLTLRAGRLCALLGPNGAGKSTLLGIVSTLVRPTSGEVVYREGEGRAEHGDRLRRQIGVLAHDAFVYGQLTGEENLAFYAQLYGVDDIDARARELLDAVGLDEEARRRPAGTYSRGMTQRLALARALLHEPRLLLLDEPFTGLDRAGAEALAVTLVSAKQRGCVLLVVTHDLEAIAGVADHVAVLGRGKLVYEASREERPGESHGGGAGFSYVELKEIYHHFTE